MTQVSQQNRPLRMNLDKSKKILDENDAFFLLNHERYVNGGATLGKTTPLAANYPSCDMLQPGGENYTNGKYRSKLTNEEYSWVYNNNGVNYIQRIGGAKGCEVVWWGNNECLPLSAEPKHSIEPFRAHLKYDKICANRHGKYLVWTNGIHDIGYLDVEASIATDSFSTEFFNLCPDDCAPLRLCVPDPCGCLQGEFVPLPANERGLKNNLLDVGIKLAYRHIYYDDRTGIWSEPSTLFYQDTKGCFDNSEGMPRCIKLRVPIGNPLVDRIEIAFFKDNAWSSTEIVEKYKKYNNSQQYWYERELAELAGYSNVDCAFDYYFCNDKQCNPIAPEEFNRVYNPIPREAQGLLAVKDFVGFFNYISGNCLIDKKEIEKIDITLECPDNTCQTEFVTIKVRAIIHNRTHNRNQFVYRTGGNFGDPDDPAGTAWFGGLNDALSGGFEIGYDQQFREKTRNFIVYVEGTSYWGEMKQWKSSRNFVNPIEYGVVAAMDTVATRNKMRKMLRNGDYFFQEYILKVPRGTRGFLRLASHSATSGEGSNQGTSTFVIGILNSLKIYGGNENVDVLMSAGVEEIYFDACASGTLDIEQAFVIEDNAVDTGSEPKAAAYHGYIKDMNGLPVEGVLVNRSGIVGGVTDHNGFYHFYNNPGSSSPLSFNIKAETVCAGAFNTVKTITIESEIGFNVRRDIVLEDDLSASPLYAHAKMRVKDCGGAGIGGVRVALSGSKYKVTDASGTATWKIRNYESRARVLRAIVLNQNGCFTVGCDNVCHPCMPISTATTPPCYYGDPMVTLADGVLNLESTTTNRNGLKAGGRYEFAVVAKGECGRQSAAYPVKYLNIPKTQEKGNEGFCSLVYKTNGVVLPDWVSCLDIVRTENLNPFELQWIVDKIERTSDSKIKLTIQSLNDYNASYLFKTNAIYQWLKGDRVEFIKNGDGSIFSTSLFGLLNYLTISPFHDKVISGDQDAPADFFNQLLINDDGKLDGLEEGAVIELQRTKECTVEPTYFGICASLPVENGMLVYPEGTFHTFDTYFVNRTIGNRPAQRFEHHSPSDFWGSFIAGTGELIRLTDSGRAYFSNKYENEKRYGRNISFNAPGQFNYFGDLVRTINPISHGDLIAMFLTDDKVGLAVSENDNSLFEVSDDLLRVGSDGIVRALGAESIVSDTQPKLSGSFGCKYDHIGSIFQGDGWVTWVDGNYGSLIKHNYQIAKHVDEGKCQTYFRKRCQQIQSWNKAITDPLNKYRLSTGLNYHTGALHITIKALRDSFIYNYSGPYKQRNDTIMFHPIAEDFLGFAPFVPEAYGKIDIPDEQGCAFLTYVNGLIYTHPINPLKWSEFYGIAVDRVVGIAINKFPEKIKVAIATEIQDEKMWFVADVVTDKPNYRSEIPPIRVQKTERKWNAAYLGNINSRVGLYGDEKPRGYYIGVTYVRDNSDGLRYGTIDNNKRVEFSELDLLITKFAISEQSGFDQNL